MLALARFICCNVSSWSGNTSTRPNPREIELNGTRISCRMYLRNHSFEKRCVTRSNHQCSQKVRMGTIASKRTNAL